MTTTTLADGKRYDRIRAAPRANAVDHHVRIGDLSRLVEHDIEILRTNLAEYHHGRERDETWEDAWARLESAWETVRSELADGKVSTPPIEVASPASRTTGATPQVDEPTATLPTAPLVLKPLPIGAPAPAISSRTMLIVRWAREQARGAELLATASEAWNRAFGDFTNFAHKFKSAGATHLGNGWLWLLANGRKQVNAVNHRVQRARDHARGTELLAAASEAWNRAFGDFTNFAHKFALTGATHLGNGWLWLVTNGRKQVKILTTSETKANAVNHSVRIGGLSRIVERDFESHKTNLAEFHHSRERDEMRENTRARLESAWETVRAELANGKASTPPTEVASPIGLTPQVDEPTSISPTHPFVLKPLPWVIGALAPVISSRTMQFHYGCHHSICIESANRLSRDHEELTGKSPLEIVRWARKHARGTELLAAASEAWNHAFFWRSLTPWKKRPGGELRQALDSAFGDFTNFAHKFALAGAMHQGSGWLWLVANGRKQVKILTTSDADCPEARGRTCLLAIDLWEHAYYLDHQNRRGEYLDAVIDRRLDWEFAEHRFRLVVGRYARRKRQPTLRLRCRPGAPKRKNCQRESRRRS